jgi:hypothetical protein
MAHAYVRYSYLVYYIQHSARDIMTTAGLRGNVSNVQRGDNFLRDK